MKDAKTHFDQCEKAQQRANEVIKKREREAAEKFTSYEKDRKYLIKQRNITNKIHEKKAYQNDQKVYNDMKNMSMTRDRLEDDKVNVQLQKFEENMNKHNELRENNLKKTQQKAQEHIEKVMKKLETVKSKNESMDTDLAFRIKIENSIKKQKANSKTRQYRLDEEKKRKQEKFRQEQERAKANLKFEDKKLADRYPHSTNP